MYRAIAFAVCVVAVSSASAQDGYERILLPVGPIAVSGAYGSEWRTFALVSNLSDTPLNVRGAAEDCGLPICGPPPPLPPKASFQVARTADCAGRGGFLYVESGRIRDVAVSLRSRDYSRALDTWGTAVPVVGPTGLFERRFGITDIPVADDKRATLRLFDVGNSTPSLVRVRIYGVRVPLRQQDAVPDTLVAERSVTPTPPSAGQAPFCPGFAEVPLTGYSGFDFLRVEIDPERSEREYWGYISVIDNETQHVTVLSPAQP